ncbi:hypothetical protein [Algoriphagus machipongonensis]|uniref:Uncharacterized protein n=1 Tax=Algoriphagus machipongonensis TaxID=388413 RepID=A3HZ67_9BACT|nr:hypothetical protein [Algoriphagus machipongonensis]EAZ80553.2 hypothetical protein ALPR1_06505 [Algoriphagus machipongonensis]
MKWRDLPDGVLLERSFLFGIVGIILGTISIVITKFQLFQIPMGPLNGVSLILQLFAVGLAILVIRKRKVSKEDKEKAQKMIVVLAAALVFFILTI